MSAMGGLSSANDHIEPSRTMYALDAVELDVGGGARAGDQRDRPPLAGGVRERGHGVGHRRDDGLRPYDADVMVGHERQRAPAGLGTGVEHDRPGLGDG